VNKVTKGKTLVSRRGEALKTLTFEGKHIALEVKSDKMESVLIILDEGAEFGREYAHPGEELHVVLKGTVEYKIGDEVFHLETGDTLWHDSSIPHTARNAGKGKAKVLSIGSPPSYM
jgi:mannose-6-phosphate isomerase-like protein (cupin superfamily)